MAANVLVTGATGFIGSFLCKRLMSDGHSVRGTILLNEKAESLVPGTQAMRVEPLCSSTSWGQCLNGVDTVIHLAARVHIMADPLANPLEEFRKVNVEGTLKLADDAAKAGVRRFVFVSSIKVNGEESSTAYNEDSPARPTDPYGISKWEAEQGLLSISRETGMEVVIVRPVLVYGPGVKANFFKMIDVVSKGIPLPLHSINNSRSFIYVGNLVDILSICAVHPAAAGHTYLVSDGHDSSTPQLLKAVANALGIPARLLPFPVTLMRLAGILFGKSAAISRITGSLVVDTSKIRRELNWIPPYSFQEGLAETAQWYRKNQMR